jgi:hypothetical protein
VHGCCHFIIGLGDDRRATFERVAQDLLKLDAEGCRIVKVLADATFATTAAVVLAALLTTSAVAQAPSAGQGDGTSATAASVPSSSPQKTQNTWRGRMLIGTRVFNDHGVWIATIDDILITDGGMVDRIVLSVTRRRLVAIPFNQFRFVPSQSIPAPRGESLRGWTRIAANAPGHFGVLLPGASRASLAEMESFRFAPPL